MWLISGNVYYCQPAPVAVTSTKKSAATWIKNKGYRWSSTYGNYVGKTPDGESSYLRLDNITVIGDIK